MDATRTSQAHPAGIARSLADLLGPGYVRAVAAARAFATGVDARQLAAVGEEKVDFYPGSFARRLDELVPLIGTKVCDGLPGSARGAGSAAFMAASRSALAPLTGLGFLRIGEDGRLYLASKAEHYHLSLGHGFPGFKLLEHARRLGIPNTTHNNTRGHVTRILEEELVAAAGGLTRADRPALDKVLAGENPRGLCRVLNMETGSLVVEAALKMVLARFWKFDPSDPKPVHEGRTPVILVVGDYDGGIAANYHGTTILTQAMRGLWPGLAGLLESSGGLVVRPVKINDIGDFRAVMEKWDTGGTKVAAFFHEIVLMNYGAIRLEKDYLAEAHALCRSRDVPVVVDEIQSGLWSPELFMFREYGLSPDIVPVGKGFPGGEYPAARVLAVPGMDVLGQFGALVTNGQEEIASLAYLVAIEFARANAPFVRQAGEHYEQGLAALVDRYPALLTRWEGRRHLASLFFRDGAKAAAFVQSLNGSCIDISVQSYKAHCPPGCLTKLPLTMTHAAVDFLLAKMDAALKTL
jgi:acetylornithine/succinyldiaminopimelate/putrescine aminotransferase